MAAGEGAAADFKALADRLIRASETDALTHAVQTVIDRWTPRLAMRAKHHAFDILPNRGGLNRRVAKTRIGSRVRVTRRYVSARIYAEKSSVSDPAAIDRGMVRHPTFGHAPIILQPVKAGWFTDPITAAIPQVRRDATDAVMAVLHRL